MTTDSAAGDPVPVSVALRHEIDPKLLEMLCCPLCKTPLKWNPQTSELISPAAKLAYPVRDGVPIMLPSEARRLEDSELTL